MKHFDSMKHLVLLILMLFSSASAQVVGRVSYIEPDAALTIVTQGDPRRLPTGFVEVLHDARLEQCKRQNYQRCQPYEWSIPFMPVTVADKLERALSEAWNRYDARVYWRVQTELGGQGSKLLNCTVGLTNFDLYRGIWDRQLLTNVPSSEFCDDLNPDWFLYIPTICSLMDSFTFWDKVAESYRRAYTHALLHYYPDYWQDVLEAIAKNVPLALWWDGVYPVLPGTSSGLILQPIISTPNPQQYLDLALEAQGKDLRGLPYMLARYPFLNQIGSLLGGSAFSRLQEAIRKLPLEPDRDGEPGLAHLEELKRNLAKREGIFSRPLQWADLFQGPQPRGSSGAATQYEYSGVGHAVFLGLQSGFITEVSPRVPIFWRSCLTETLPPVPVLVPVPMPVVHLNSRVDTQWLSVPEGYGIPGVKDVPRF
jgi:hypothetical protein